MSTYQYLYLIESLLHVHIPIIVEHHLLLVVVSATLHPLVQCLMLEESLRRAQMYFEGGGGEQGLGLGMVGALPYPQVVDHAVLTTHHLGEHSVLLHPLG